MRDDDLLSTVEKPLPPPSTDAGKIRARGRPAGSRGRRAAPHAAPVVDPTERDFWGRQIQGFWNNLAQARGYGPIPDAQVSAIGEPAALTAKKYLKDAQADHPEYLLLFVLTPYILGAIRVEWERWTRSRPPRGPRPGSERDGLRSEGLGEEQLGEVPPATSPYAGPGS